MFDLSERFERINLLLSEGALEIMEKLAELGTGRFTDFRQLKNNRTGKIFSGNTISTRLKELIAAGAVENVVISSEGQRRVVGYQLTENGKKALAISIEYEKKLEHVLPKKG